MPNKICAKVLVAGAVLTLVFPTISGCRPNPRRPAAKKPAPAKATRAKTIRPASLTVSVVSAETSAPLASAVIGIGKKYLMTETSGAVAIDSLSPGETEILIRAPGRRILRTSYRLASGGNHLTAPLENETATPGGPGRGHVAYLTIDDGPSRRWTGAVLNILKRQSVPATFFVVGKRADHRRDLVRRAYLEGHAIGNHTFSHDYNELYAGPVKNYLASLAQNSLALEEIIGTAPTITRPPGGPVGNFKPGWQSAVDAAGYTTVLWNISTGDGSTQTTSDQMIENAKKYLDRVRPGDPAIILMHDVRPPIVQALPEIIAEIRQRGFEFAVITDKLRVPRLVTGPWRRR